MELPERTSNEASELHVWQARLDDSGWPGIEQLPSAERVRAARLGGAEARKRWVAARWALRGVLGTYLDAEPDEIELCVGYRGKPRLMAADATLRFNLSHSAGLALVVVGRSREVGIDVEWIKPRSRLPTLSRRVLQPAEAEAVAAAPAKSRLASFHMAWARQEAVAKCLGTGLHAPLPDVSVAVSNLDVGSGYAAAVAIGAEAMPALRYFTFKPH